MTAVSLAITLACAYALFINPSTDVEKSLLLKLLLGFFLLLGLVASIICIRNLISPIILFEATDRGVVVYRVGSVALAEPFFIPWERVEGMEYMVHKGIAPSGDLVTIKTVAVKVRTDEGWRPAAYLKNNFDEAKSLLHLDAITGTPHGPELLRQMEVIKAQHS